MQSSYIVVGKLINIGHFGSQYQPFYRVIWAILQCKVADISMQNGWYDKPIDQAWFHFTRFWLLLLILFLHLLLASWKGLQFAWDFPERVYVVELLYMRLGSGSVGCKVKIFFHETKSNTMKTSKALIRGHVHSAVKLAVFCAWFATRLIGRTICSPYYSNPNRSNSS